MRGLALALLLAAAPVAITPAVADPVAQARAAIAALDRAGADLSAAEGARDRVTALTAVIAAHEEGLAAVRESLRAIAIREATLRRTFDARSAELGRLLGVLAAVERTDGPLLLLHPAGPLGTVQSGLLAAEVTPALAAEAERLRAELAELATLRALQDAAAQTVTESLSAAQSARVALSTAIADRTPLPPPLAQDAAALARLAETAASLAAFAVDLETRPLPIPPAATPESFAAARGTLPLPVRGTLLRAAGQADAAGVVRPGIVLATRPRALVTAPWPATVRYAGPLLDYANVMVLEPAPAYLLIIAGLDTTHANVGEVVAAGAPLGLMGGDEPRVMEFLAGPAPAGASGGLSETLYVELRHEGMPLDPGEWFGQIGD